MTMQVTIRGAADLRRALAKLNGPARRRAQIDGLAAGARVVETWAKVYAPVDTGALRSSIQVDEPVTPDLATVSVGVEYAVHQEFGTATLAAHPFLRPALDQHQAEIVAAVAAELAAAVDAVGK